MSEYANPTGIHRDSRFNLYRAQSNGGIESFDFRGFYQRPDVKSDTNNCQRRTILGLENDEDNVKELEKKGRRKRQDSK